MSLVFYVLGIVTGLAAYWCSGRLVQHPQKEPWIVVNGQTFDDLEAACEFADWLEKHGHEILFCVRDVAAMASTGEGS